MKEKLFLLICFFPFFLGAQESNTQILKSLNSALTIYGTDDISLFTLLENTGSLEQRQANLIQRIKLSGIGKINVAKTSAGFTVNVQCTDSISCINIIKSDMTSAMKPAEAFFFSHAKGANMFAENLGELSRKYSIDEKKAIVELWTEAGDLKADKSAIEPIQKVDKQQEKNITEDDEDEQEDKRIAKQNQKGRTDDEMIEKLAREQKRKQLDKQNEKRKSKKQEEIDEEVDAEKSSKANDKNDALNGRPEPNDVLPDYEPLCKSLNAIFKAGKQSAFKDIEGNETNAEKKINESKLKLKGAKRNYLSWFKKQRAFMAEYKTSSDLELILVEFDKLQTELENCLEGNWDDVDHSSDAIYANAQQEVKDVEYINTELQSQSSMRIMINSANGKHTLFVRIQ